MRFGATPSGGMQCKTALITGASRPLGLGFAVARQLAEQGHHVILTARALGEADARASELRRVGLSATALRLDSQTAPAFAKRPIISPRRSGTSTCS